MSAGSDDILFGISVEILLDLSMQCRNHMFLQQVLDDLHAIAIPQIGIGVFRSRMVKIICGKVLIDWVVLVVESCTVELPFKAEIDLQKPVFFCFEHEKPHISTEALDWFFENTLHRVE